MKRKIIYITGISGTGKTTLSNEFKKRGNITIDIDDHAHWEHKETGKTDHWFPGKSVDFFNTHQWVCDLEKLKEIFKENSQKDILVFGVVDKEEKLFPLFDKIILLTCDTRVAFKRIDDRVDNEFGKGEVEKEWIKSWKDNFEQDLIRKGAIAVSSEDNIETVINNIINICKI